jgi:vacuolar protein 8
MPLTPQSSFSNGETVQAMIEMLTKGAPEQKAAAEGTLWNLAFSCSAESENLGSARAEHFAALFGLLSAGSPSAQATAAVAVRDWVTDREKQLTLSKAGCIPPLVHLLTTGNDEAQAGAAGALGKLARNNTENKMAIAATGGIDPLRTLSVVGCGKAQSEAVCALLALDAL